MELKPEGPVGLKKREVVMSAAVEYLADRGWAGQAELCRDVFAEVDELSLGRLDQIIKPIAGLYSLFAALEAAACRIAIATTDLSSRARLAMQHLGLEDRIAYIAGAEMVRRTKPHPDLLELVLQELAVPASRVAMVGDAITDVMMGVNAGVGLTIGVLSGLAPDIGAMKQITPHLIASIADIKIKKND
jgi:phosphoglycolate phosphatase